MSQKSPSKRKRLAKADLNFVSQQSFEQVLTELDNLRSKHIKPIITKVDADTAIFQLRYQQADITTAEVSGRLKRWAGDMTHIYCDGRFFRQRNIRAKLRSKKLDIFILVSVWLFVITSVFSGNTTDSTLFDFFFTGLIALILAFIVYGVFSFLRMIVKIVAESISHKRYNFVTTTNRSPKPKIVNAFFMLLPASFATLSYQKTNSVLNK